ncbi:TPA: hypothetical protein ACH3X1_013064 [Trebouxia sp. C0004]
MFRRTVNTDDADTITSSFDYLDMADTGQIARLLLCPITNKLIVEPAITADGHTYERRATKHWLQQNDTSPVTHLPLPHKRLVSNVVIRSATLNHPQQLQWH